VGFDSWQENTVLRLQRVQELEEAAALEAGWIVDPDGYVEQVLANLDEVAALYRDQLAQRVPPVAQDTSEKLLEGYQMTMAAASEIVRVMRISPDLEAYTAATEQAGQARRLITEVRLEIPSLVARCTSGQG
jgi:hypothetical protein